MKVYERSGVEVVSTMKLIDCQEYTDGGPQTINDAEFSFGVSSRPYVCASASLNARRWG